MKKCFSMGVCWLLKKCLNTVFAVKITSVVVLVTDSYRCFLFSSTLVKKTEKVFFEIHSFLINLNFFFFFTAFHDADTIQCLGINQTRMCPPPPLLSSVSNFKSDSAHFSDQVDFLLIKSLNEVRQHIVLCQNKNLNSESHKQPVIQTGDSD